ncbi:aldose 1-epimerase [Leucothrix arctica]|uniref:Aldose 1-epimerase n=1 Tax=Leucothrix arctica TaxID=1481894 RepID=A0A317C8J1_9GAMM|nr:aldose 1-epimerase [Leucothrix arctica]PWQ94985.1 hypothetical protein DKT75_13705 [Leucothrix arctica]
MLEISNKDVVLQIRDDLGAAISRYDFVDGHAIFRPAPGDSKLPFEMACNLLVPWCNRISDGGFFCNDTFYPLAPNIEGDESPLHGDAFLKAWTCIATSDTSLTLELVSKNLGPFEYRAEVIYTLQGKDLTIDLSVTNLSTLELPYGLGLHPWFKQDEDTEIQASIQHVITSNEHNLPESKVVVSDKPELDFRTSNKLPVTGLDNCFTGWDQRAVLTWPSRNMSVVVDAGKNFTECHIYSKNRQGSFFCFEPVTHPVNAHNWPDQSLKGLTLLREGETITTHCRFSPEINE